MKYSNNFSAIEYSQQKFYVDDKKFNVEFMVEGNFQRFFRFLGILTAKDDRVDLKIEGMEKFLNQ